ncbi:terminase small subunit [Pectobacterium phage Khlen]|uniref:DNA maturase A n=28 Tax=Phimunavirus TaxID=2560202 RepID=A0A3G8FJS9_9CAUD|nr:terminase small subunit [Pectobacterium phage PP90]YP_009591968.1 terminase small subunit [Pectobacterium phage PhiM1]YP_009625565.1 terminase small subunit [Pectobacterium phage vB_PatP_CB5]YP_009811862.1 terminase small subunit [Pectobacterium phage Gaspode]YP_009811971.1 terminase small subunit [Pectobacterium phage Lelidair]YP_009812129.1 terminase small subunit [Pectobacterium phage Nobby]YP_009817105.1 terminase small subunit [Pectobacterium phage Clickz]YP_009817211.1 terminase sma
MAASQSKLAELHEMLAEVMLDDLKQSKEEGIPLPAANLGVIRQFLKDNDISASMDADDMAAIRDEFKGVADAARAERKSKLTSALEDDAYSHILQ